MASIEGTPSRFAHLECYKLWVEESAGMGVAQLADVRQPVCLVSEPSSLGKVMATLDGGRWLYVLWMRRAGHERRLTKERATDLRPTLPPGASARRGAAGPPPETRLAAPRLDPAADDAPRERAGVITAVDGTWPLTITVETPAA